MGAARFPATVATLPAEGLTGGVWATKVGVPTRVGGSPALAPEGQGTARLQ